FRSDDELAQPGSMPLEQRQYEFEESLASARPAALQVARGVLHDRRKHVLPRRGDPAVMQRGNRDLHDRLGRVLAILRRVEGAICVVEIRADQQTLAELLGGYAGKGRQCRKREV